MLIAAVFLIARVETVHRAGHLMEECGVSDCGCYLAVSKGWSAGACRHVREPSRGRASRERETQCHVLRSVTYWMTVQPLKKADGGGREISVLRAGGERGKWSADGTGFLGG